MDAQQFSDMVKTQPLLGAGQWAEDQPAQVGAAPHLALDQPGALQRLDVLGRGGQRDREGLGQLPDRSLATREFAQHPPPRGVAERVEDGVEVGCL